MQPMIPRPRGAHAGAVKPRHRVCATHLQITPQYIARSGHTPIEKLLGGGWCRFACCRGAYSDAGFNLRITQFAQKLTANLLVHLRCQFQLRIGLGILGGNEGCQDRGGALVSGLN